MKDVGPAYRGKYSSKTGYRYSRKEYFNEFGTKPNISIIKDNLLKINEDKANIKLMKVLSETQRAEKAKQLSSDQLIGFNDDEEKAFSRAKKLRLSTDFNPHSYSSKPVNDLQASTFHERSKSKIVVKNINEINSLIEQDQTSKRNTQSRLGSQMHRSSLGSVKESNQN